MNALMHFTILRQKVEKVKRSLTFINSVVVYKSCKEIYKDNPSSLSGVYNLESGNHHCLMDKSTDSCGKGGWTLALKVDGTKVRQKLKKFATM